MVAIQKAQQTRTIWVWSVAESLEAMRKSSSGILHTTDMGGLAWHPFSANARGVRWPEEAITQGANKAAIRIAHEMAMYSIVLRERVCELE